MSDTEVRKRVKKSLQVCDRRTNHAEAAGHRNSEDTYV